MGSDPSKPANCQLQLAKRHCPAEPALYPPVLMVNSSRCNLNCQIAPLLGRSILHCIFLAPVVIKGGVQFLTLSYVRVPAARTAVI
jgi:hypothetical protein